MSTGWENYDPAPIEVFHGEALKEFHRRREELGKSPDEGLNGIEFNKIIAAFKVKIMKQYGITSDAIPKAKLASRTEDK